MSKFKKDYIADLSYLSADQIKNHKDFIVVYNSKKEKFPEDAFREYFTNYFRNVKNPLIALFALENGYLESIFNNPTVSRNSIVKSALAELYPLLDLSLLKKESFQRLAEIMIENEDSELFMQFVVNFENFEFEDSELKANIWKHFSYLMILKFPINQTKFHYSEEGKEALNKMISRKSQFFTGIISHDNAHYLSSHITEEAKNHLTKFAEINEDLIEEFNDSGVPINIMIQISGIGIEAEIEDEDDMA